MSRKPGRTPPKFDTSTVKSVLGMVGTMAAAQALAAALEFVSKNGGQITIGYTGPLQAREFAPEEIRQAPDGIYKCRFEGKWPEFSERPRKRIIEELEVTDDRKKYHNLPPVLPLPDMYFGPMPQPEESQNEKS